VVSRSLLLGALGVLAAACGKDPAPITPVTLQRRPGRPGERFAVRVEHKTINQVSPHQAVHVSKKGDYVDEVQADARVVRNGTFDAEEVRIDPEDLSLDGSKQESPEAKPSPQEKPREESPEGTASEPDSSASTPDEPKPSDG